MGAMNLAIRISFLASGLLLLAGMLSGVVKYRAMLTSVNPYRSGLHRHRPPRRLPLQFRDAGDRQFLEYGPYSDAVQLGAAGSVLAFLTQTVSGYLMHGLRDRTDNLFRELTFTTTWYMYLLIAGEVGGLTFRHEGEEIKHVLFTDGKQDYRTVGEGFLAGDGHCSFAPDAEWVVTDRNYYDVFEKELMIYNVRTKRGVRLGRFPMRERRYMRSDLRCDLHPRWDRAGTAVCFDALETAGWTRQLHVAYLDFNRG